jgi:hypothetical protein
MSSFNNFGGGYASRFGDLGGHRGRSAFGRLRDYAVQLSEVEEVAREITKPALAERAQRLKSVSFDGSVYFRSIPSRLLRSNAFPKKQRAAVVKFTCLGRRKNSTKRHEPRLRAGS